MSKLQQIKELRYATGLSLIAARDIVEAGRYDEVMRECGGKAPAKLPDLATMMGGLMPNHPARKEYESILADAARYRWLAQEAYWSDDGESVGFEYEMRVPTGVTQIAHQFHGAPIPSLDGAIDKSRL